jgi:predicted peptidase
MWSLLQTHPEKWAAVVVLAAYDNFTAPMSISGISLWVFHGDAERGDPVDLVRGRSIEEAERQLALDGVPQRGSRYVQPGVC